MPEPKFKLGEVVEVNLHYQTNLPDNCVRATVMGVATESSAKVPFLLPVYTTNKGTYNEGGLRAIQVKGE